MGNTPHAFWVHYQKGILGMSQWLILIGMVTVMSGQAVLVESSNPQNNIPAKVTKYGAIIGLIGWVLLVIGLII